MNTRCRWANRVTHEDGSLLNMSYSGFNTTIVTTGKASDGAFQITDDTEYLLGKVTGSKMV